MKDGGFLTGMLTWTQASSWLQRSADLMPMSYDSTSLDFHKISLMRGMFSGSFETNLRKQMWGGNPKDGIQRSSNAPIQCGGSSDSVIHVAWTFVLTPGERGYVHGHRTLAAARGISASALHGFTVQGLQGGLRF